MKHVDPPVWLERVLLFLLPSRDRETVSGDLYEEFRERKSSQLGPLRASLWYLRQVLSFSPGKVRSALMQRSALTLLCVFTATCAAWLGLRGLHFRHPGYMGREMISVTIVCEAALTLIALRFRGYTALRILAIMGTLALFWLTGRVLLATVRGSQIEGYILLIALALTAQGLLTLFTLSVPRGRAKLIP